MSKMSEGSVKKDTLCINCNVSFPTGKLKINERGVWSCPYCGSSHIKELSNRKPPFEYDEVNVTYEEGM